MVSSDSISMVYLFKVMRRIYDDFKKALVGLSVMTVDNFLQLPSVTGKHMLYKACNNYIYLNMHK